MRLIDADRLWNKCNDTPWYNNADRDEIALQLINDAPTITAVEVVRCGECKYYDNPVCTLLSEEPGQYGSGSVVEMEYSDFCSYGERKE